MGSHVCNWRSYDIYETRRSTVVQLPRVRCHRRVYIANALGTLLLTYIFFSLAFGAPFGMIEKGADVAEVRNSPDAKPTFAPAIEVLNRRGEVSAYVQRGPDGIEPTTNSLHQSDRMFPADETVC